MVVQPTDSNIENTVHLQRRSPPEIEFIRLERNWTEPNGEKHERIRKFLDERLQSGLQGHQCILEGSELA